MRKPKYLSNSSVSLFYKDRKEFYIKYLLESRPPRLPQTEPMAVGSAFDAYVKSTIAGIIYGKTGIPEDLRFETLFEKQVESQNRDFALEAGKVCMDAYRSSGALSDLMVEIGLADTEPRFEFKVEKTLKHQDVVGGIPVLGYPDLYFILVNGIHVIKDFKVNGFCAKRETSPAKGYIKSRDAWVGKQSRSHMQSHRDAQPMVMHGITVNAVGGMQDMWAEQLMLYGWLEGVEVGDPLIGGIEQLSGQPHKQRISSHRVKMEPSIQFTYMDKLANVWLTIESGHIFDDLSREDNDALIEELDESYDNIDYSDPNMRFLNKHTRSQ